MRILIVASTLFGSLAFAGCAHHDSAARAEMYGTPPGYLEASSKPPPAPMPEQPAGGESGILTPEAPSLNAPVP
jgi:hypothetical protein